MALKRKRLDARRKRQAFNDGSKRCNSTYKFALAVVAHILPVALRALLPETIGVDVAIIVPGSPWAI